LHDQVPVKSRTVFECTGIMKRGRNGISSHECQQVVVGAGPRGPDLVSLALVQVIVGEKIRFRVHVVLNEIQLEKEKVSSNYTDIYSSFDNILDRAALLASVLYKCAER